MKHIKVTCTTSITFVIFFFLSTNVFSQNDELKKLTLSIIDANKSKFEQAHAIYTWITCNIRYDVKAYLSGKSNNASVYQTLKKKQGICSDYALLFDEMCQRAGIESGIIVGYSKGTGYYKGGGFYRAEHAWNIFRIDTMWYIADVTWGSGYLEKKPAWLDKLKYSLFKTPYKKNDLKFVKSPADHYFNPNPTEFRKTHLPLDPKWQLSENILTMEQFESDSTFEPKVKYEYEKEIAAAVGLPKHQQLFTEGMNGKMFNEKNNFNVTLGHLALIKASNCLNEKISKESYKTFEECYANSKHAKDLIFIYKNDIDTVFIKRLYFLRGEGKKGSRLYSALSKETSFEKKRFAKKERELVKYQNILTRRSAYYHQAKHTFERQYAPPKGHKLEFDSALFSNLQFMLSESSDKIAKYIRQIDTLIIAFSEGIKADSLITAKYTFSKQALIDHLVTFKELLQKEDIALIYPHWNQISCNYDTGKRTLILKQISLNSVRQTFSAILYTISSLSSEYRTKTELLKKYYRYTEDAQQTAILFEETQTLLNGCFTKFISIIEKYSDCYHKLVDFNNTVHRLNLSLIQSRSIASVNDFVRFNNEIYANEKRKYSIEKKLIREAQNKVSYYHHTLETKLHNFRNMENNAN